MTSEAIQEAYDLIDSFEEDTEPEYEVITKGVA